jgi:hypothetical protein
MGVRGTLPTPTKIRILNGNPSRRPLPANEPQFTPGIPARPSGMSGRARKQWDQLIGEMANSGVLRLAGARSRCSVRIWPCSIPCGRDWRARKRSCEEGQGEKAADLWECTHSLEPDHRGTPHPDQYSRTFGSDHYSTA